MGKINEKTSNDKPKRHLLENDNRVMNFLWKDGYDEDGNWKVSENLTLKKEAEEDRKKQHEKWGI